MTGADPNGSGRRRPFWVGLRSRALAVSPSETTFAVRGFHPGAPTAQAALERHGATFVEGFNATLAAVDVAELEQPLSRVPAAERGFAYEGAGMGLMVLDLMTPGRSDRLGRLLRTHGAPYIYTVHVGAGWALARLRLRPRGRLRNLDPVLRWLALDGYGFHEAAFRTRRFVTERTRPRRLSGYERNAFDQGLGRGLWFVECADVERLARTIAGFQEDRRADLWGGVGLAAAYSLAAGPGDLERLKDLAGEYRLHLASGAVFAAVARHTAGNVVPHTRSAAELLCGCTVEEAAEAADRTRADLGADPTGASYERWRERVRDWLAGGARATSEPELAPPVV